MDRKPQSAADMALQLREEKKGNKLYKAESDAHKSEMISQDIENHLNLLQTVFKRGKVNLENADEVKEVTLEYMKACSLAGSFPSITGLAASFGISRQALYQYVRTHPHSETAKTIEVVKTMFADMLLNASLYKNADNITTIFLLKNSETGFQDKIEIQAAPSIRDDVATKESLIKQAALLPGSDEGEDFESFLIEDNN